MFFFQCCILARRYETEAKQYCPEPLLGIFNYTESVMDRCNNDTELNLIHVGEVYCLLHLQDNDTYYLSVLNPGVVDNTAFFRFTCFVSHLPTVNITLLHVLLKYLIILSHVNIHIKRENTIPLLEKLITKHIKYIPCVTCHSLNLLCFKNTKIINEFTNKYFTKLTINDRI
ncbi:hypothetical protein KUTeg_024638 [Tegillarca granosa]|uniref:Uncharacterized protein n=1 Tax=Tegillarca granosa TaxID=220873 RepID=A0ABQ9E3E5_TEGGR|nr:hypothetical protein KUTeg_024638 [Tegillarca granosa]